MKIALICTAILLFLLALVLVALPLPAYLDFQVLYHANLGLLRGIELYDHAGQVNLIAGLANVSPEHVYVLPFPYPPWYALSTLWLAWLPIAMAARLWFGLNILMLLAAVWLLTDGWPAPKRLASFVFAAVFPPALGGLFVGQYDFPVLLGAALMAYALRHERAWLAALASALLTFKPHLGAPILLIVAIYLLQRRDAYGHKALGAMLVAGGALFAAGFLATRAWPLAYYHSLIGFQGDISRCMQCNNAAMDLASGLGAGFDQLLWFAGALLILISTWLVWQWRGLTSRPGWLVSAAVLATLFASPYLLNYDYVLLLLPFLLAAETESALEWTALAIAYLLPLVSLAAGLGTRANAVYVLALIVLIAMQTLRLRAKPVARQGITGVA
jgi:hypothetical protein